MNNFFTQGLNNISKNSDVLEFNVKKLEPNTSGNFFTQHLSTTPSNLDQSDKDLFEPIGTVDIENFFGQNKSVNNFLREYSKGKSFQFSTWNPYDTYNNDEFIQDFVKYNKKL